MNNFVIFEYFPDLKGIETLEQRQAMVLFYHSFEYFPDLKGIETFGG